MPVVKTNSNGNRVKESTASAERQRSLDWLGFKHAIGAVLVHRAKNHLGASGTRYVVVEQIASGFAGGVAFCYGCSVIESSTGTIARERVELFEEEVMACPGAALCG